MDLNLRFHNIPMDTWLWTAVPPRIDSVSWHDNSMVFVCMVKKVRHPPQKKKKKHVEFRSLGPIPPFAAVSVGSHLA